MLPRLARCAGFGFVIVMDTQLTWYGQAAFKIATPGGKVLLIDPWLTNPVFERGQDEIAALNHVDLVLVTHGHSDHVGNAVEIGKKTRAKLVATFDLSAAIVTTLGYPSELADVETTGHMGGTLTLLGGEIAVTFVPAWHGSGVSKEETAPSVYGGSPAGMVIAIRGGPTIYHTGDAVKLVNPRQVIPMHYGTFPVLTGTPEMFNRELKQRHVKADLRVMKIGETIELSE